MLSPVSKPAPMGVPRPNESRDGIFPGYPHVVRKADGERELAVLNWGFVLLQKDKAPKRVTNIRDDKAQTQVLAAVIRAAPLSRAGVVLLRAERREARDVALVLDQRR